MLKREFIPQYVAILKDARRLLELKDESFVCHAINHTTRWTGRERGSELTKWIEQMLEGDGTVIVWLELIARVDFDEHMPGFSEMKRDYRIRWIDHMVAFLEECERESFQIAA